MTTDLVPGEDLPLDLLEGSVLPEDRFIDRELSWLAFNQRVLELAENQDLPCWSAPNSLAIFASNLDEFYMVRVGPSAGSPPESRCEQQAGCCLEKFTMRY